MAKNAHVREDGTDSVRRAGPKKPAERLRFMRKREDRRTLEERLTLPSEIPRDMPPPIHHPPPNVLQRIG